MSNDPIRRVLKWKRLEIGLSHCPLMGDTRHGRKVSAGYGHIRGSYGHAEDGMSLDVYVGPDLGSDQIYRVRQVVPETGELDEYKYIIGTWSADEAKALFLAHMPLDRFDGVEAVPFSDLEQYQKPLAKAATGEELNYLASLWGLSSAERVSVQLEQKALVTLGPPLPPIHRILFC
jgi:hypothetical protein